MTKYSYLLEDFKLCEHTLCWSSYLDGFNSLYNCCRCGKQFTEEEYKKLKKEKN